MKVFELIELLSSVEQMDLALQGVVVSENLTLKIMGTRRINISVGEGYIHRVGLSLMEEEPFPNHARTCQSLLPQAKIYDVPDEITDGDTEVYLSYIYENPDNSTTVKNYFIVSHNIRDSTLYLIGGEEDISMREECPYEDVQASHTVESIRQELNAYDMELPLIIYIDKLEPEYTWEPDEDEMEYYKYIQTQLLTKDWYYKSFSVQTILMRDGECMFTHQTYSDKSGMTVRDGLELLNHFSEDEYVSISVEIDNGNGTAMPHYFSVWSIEQKDGKCILTANVNHEGLYDTRSVDIGALSS